MYGPRVAAFDHLVANRLRLVIGASALAKADGMSLCGTWM